MATDPIMKVCTKPTSVDHDVYDDEFLIPKTAELSSRPNKQLLA